MQKIKCKDCDYFLEYPNKTDEEFRNTFKFASKGLYIKYVGGGGGGEGFCGGHEIF